MSTESYLLSILSKAPLSFMLLVAHASLKLCLAECMRCAQGDNGCEPNMKYAYSFGLAVPVLAYTIPAVHDPALAILLYRSKDSVRTKELNMSYLEQQGLTRKHEGDTGMMPTAGLTYRRSRFDRLQA